jgi:hypothetical protein
MPLIAALAQLLEVVVLADDPGPAAARRPSAFRRRASSGSRRRRRRVDGLASRVASRYLNIDDDGIALAVARISAPLPRDPFHHLSPTYLQAAKT